MRAWEGTVDGSLVSSATHPPTQTDIQWHHFCSDFVYLETAEDQNEEASERSAPAVAPTGRRNPPGGKSSVILGWGDSHQTLVFLFFFFSFVPFFYYLWIFLKNRHALFPLSSVSSSGDMIVLHSVFTFFYQNKKRKKKKEAEQNVDMHFMFVLPVSQLVLRSTVGTAAVWAPLSLPRANGFKKDKNFVAQNF